MAELNPAQARAVAHSQGPLLLVAGAGSGKTMVITRRIARLIQEGMATPHQILGVTFTNKAAAEMKERVRKLTDKDVLISTFHAFGVRVLRQYGQRVGLQSGFVIYDMADQASLLKECIKTLDLNPEQFKPNAIAGKIGRLKDELIDPATYKSFAQTPYDATISKIYTQYDAMLKENNALDFSDLILLVVKLLGTCSDVLEHYQERFRYLLVDEYQDTNFAQYQLVKLLSQKYRNICVVGDPDQSIYSWRGADIRNILNFEKDYPGTTVINLEQNYRSTANILRAANHVIEKNLQRKPKNLCATRGEGHKIYYYQGSDGRDEADFVAQKIKEALHKGIRLSDMAVLYRVHALSRSLEESLMSMQIPYRILGGMKFYDRKEVKDILAYLRFIVNPSDRVAFQRIINIPKRGLGAAALARLQEFAIERNMPFPQVLDECVMIADFPKRSLLPLQSFVALIANLRAQMNRISTTDLLQKLLEAIRYEDYLKADDPANFVSRQENIKELFAAMSEYEQRRPDGNLAGYLEEVTLITDIEESENTEERLVLMTIHNAKGLEYHTCFLIGMEEGLFPHVAAEEDDDVEEERRLCYVGMTRAKDVLYLTSSARRLMYGRWKQCDSSRFLADVPQECIEPVYGSSIHRRSLDDEDEQDRFSVAHSYRSTATLAAVKTPVVHASPWKVGQMVHHEIWGAGRIVAVSGQDEDTKLRILFGQNHGMKDLLLKYAKLSKVST